MGGCAESPVAHCLPQPPSPCRLLRQYHWKLLYWWVGPVFAYGLFYLLKNKCMYVYLILFDRFESGVCWGWLQEGLASSELHFILLGCLSVLGNSGNLHIKKHACLNLLSTYLFERWSYSYTRRGRENGREGGRETERERESSISWFAPQIITMTKVVPGQSQELLPCLLRECRDPKTRHMSR